MILVGQINELTIRQEGDRVLLLRNGQLLAAMPWQAADAVAKALIGKARQAEEHAKAEQIAYDSAILLRSGAPFALSSRPDIVTEAKKEAAWNSDLRRYIRNRGIQSQERFGSPTLIQYPPKGECNDG